MVISCFYIFQNDHLSKSSYKHNTKVLKVAQSSPTLCDPMDCSLPGSSVHGILPRPAASKPAILNKTPHVTGVYLSWCDY